MHRVLILDDDADILELCSIILEALGYDTVTEHSCQDVIAKVNNARPDVILIDNWIPDIGGIQATRLIKTNEETKAIPVIFFSASNNVEQYSKDANAEYFLQKPFDIAELEGIVRVALENRHQ